MIDTLAANGDASRGSLGSKHAVRSVGGKRAAFAFVGVLTAHGVLQWFAWAGHPGHTVNGVVLPWWSVVWTIVAAPASWFTNLDLASHWGLILVNGVFWGCVGAGVTWLPQRRA